MTERRVGSRTTTPYQRSTSDPGIKLPTAPATRLSTRDKLRVPGISQYDVGSIFKAWLCQGSEKRPILVEQRIKIKNHT